MHSSLQKTLLGAALIGALALSPLAISHFDDKEVMQSYRQSYFAMIATNFGPMVAMLKGEMPWDTERMQANADQLATLASMDIMRGFSPGTEKGTTRAKPEIWENMDDFKEKMAALERTTAELKTAAASGERAAIGQAVGAVGESCKACHDEYKAEDYLY